jgi:hypothetical protein
MRLIVHVAILRYRTRPIDVSPLHAPLRAFVGARVGSDRCNLLKISALSPTPFVGLPPDLVPPFRRVCVSSRNTTLTTELAALARVAWSLPSLQTTRSSWRGENACSRARLSARGRPVARTPFACGASDTWSRHVSPVGLTNTTECHASYAPRLTLRAPLRSGAPTNPPTKHSRC